RIIGAGTAAMKDSLETVIWGDQDHDDYFFAADFYLYLVLTLQATAAYFGGGQKAVASDFYACFHLGETVLDDDQWKSSKILDKAVIGGNTLRFWLDQNPGAANTPLASLTCEVNGRRRTVTKTAWFNAVRRLVDL